MDYEAGGKHYSWSYQELREEYHKVLAMSDYEFMQSLPETIHLAVFIAYIKELGNSCLGDEGIVHQLVHLLALRDESFQKQNLKRIRTQFKTVLKLA